MTTGNEERKGTRIETNATLDFMGFNVLVEHQIEDISSGGLSLKSSALEPVGSTVMLTVNFPDYEESISVHGRVAWVKPDTDQMGLEFVGLGDQDRKILTRYLEEREARAQA